MGGKSGGSSSSNSNSTQNTDKRLIVSDQGLGISSDTSTVNVTALDQGAIKGAVDITSKALDTVAGANAMQGQSLDSIIGLAGDLFRGGFKALETSQDQVNTAYQTATETKQAAGTIDNRTIMVLGIAAAGALAYMAHGK